MAGGAPVLVEALTHVYDADGASAPALSDVSFRVDAGRRATIVGPSGSGKSTLLTILAGLQRPTSGRVVVGEVEVTAASEAELSALRRRMSVVLQDPRRNLLPYGTALDNVAFAQRADPTARRQDPQALLASLDLAALVDARVDRLSGGERQRVAIAAGLALDPSVLLVDEPTSALDARSRDDVLELLERVSADRGATLLTITHDDVVAERLGGALPIEGGRLRATG
ncbi:ABC transporter ATP-binding protein [uncultured Amnibacterium sp.]|uniref:ABC transporter ATP-binding protein n=1 Tax=uncultured Amnibacterium sp. TaxID=1631851 RepID=UPI0035C98EE9